MGAARENVERGLELWNSGEFDELLNRWAPDGVEVNPVETLNGITAIGDRYRRMRAGFPDQQVRVLRWVEDGDTVICEGEVTATHSGPLTLSDGSQLPPTGQRLTIQVATVFELRDGKTVAVRQYYDQLPVMLQLGVVAQR